MEKITLSEKFAAFTESWRPKVVAELNGQEVKVVRLRGPFTWHHHEHEDELFPRVEGRLPHGVPEPPRRGTARG